MSDTTWTAEHAATFDQLVDDAQRTPRFCDEFTRGEVLSIIAARAELARRAERIAELERRLATESDLLAAFAFYISPTLDSDNEDDRKAAQDIAEKFLRSDHVAAIRAGE